jgi:hypothetical protein
MAGAGGLKGCCGLRVTGCGSGQMTEDGRQKSDYRTTMIEGLYFEMRSEAKRSRAAESIDSRRSSLLLSERVQGKRIGLIDIF